MKHFQLTLSALLLSTAAVAHAAPAPSAATSATVLSAAKKITLTEKLAPERPTLFLFYRSGSAMEQELTTQLEKETGGRVGLYWIPLKTGDEPLAKQCEVTTTPYGIVYDRRGRLTGKSAEPNEIRMALATARRQPHRLGRR